MIKEMKYKVVGFECITPCPIQENTRIGSLDCQECEHNVGGHKTNKIVFCNQDKSIEDSNTIRKEITLTKVWVKDHLTWIPRLAIKFDEEGCICLSCIEHDENFDLINRLTTVLSTWKTYSLTDPNVKKYWKTLEDIPDEAWGRWIKRKNEQYNYTTTITPAQMKMHIISHIEDYEWNPSNNPFDNDWRECLKS